jgi:hypothetical protein
MQAPRDISTPTTDLKVLQTKCLLFKGSNLVLPALKRRSVQALRVFPVRR